MRQFRIVHTESSLGWGGQEWRVFLELRWMAAHGHSVWLIAPPNSRIYAEARQAGIQTLAFGYRRIDWTLGLMRLVHFFRQHKIDVVNTHSSRDAWLAGVAAKIARVPFIIRSRHIEVEYPNRFLGRVAFELIPDYVLATSRKIVHRLVSEVGIDPQRIECWPTGVDIERFSPRPSGAVQRELGLPSETPLVGMISVLRSWKGHFDFIEAARLILAKQPHLHFIIAGEGPGREEIRKRIAAGGLGDRVHLLGYRSDVPEVLASLAVLVLPSTAHEGVPQIILQAQAMKRPVVGTQIGGIPEVIQHGETGFIVPPRNPVALAGAIEQIMENPAVAESMAARAYERIQSHHSLDVMGHHLERLYAEYLGAVVQG